MLHLEGIQQNEDERLFDNISLIEKEELSIEYIPMWDAENSACFPHFLEFAKTEMKDTLDLALNENELAINEISYQYQKYRNDLELNFKQTNPESYQLFINAVSIGDKSVAEILINEYIEEIRNLKSENIDDDEE